MLHYFGFDPTAALAGLGIGGIAVALAAQKTLENVIAGLSLIFDKAVRVGDFLKLGEIVGTVDYIGLRSTRIRTLDRTILSVPNGQIANVDIETLSARDKFWFHHFVGLRYETTVDQMRAVVDGMRSASRHASRASIPSSVRVRFFRLGSFSLDIEVFAYVDASDWEAFLEIAAGAAAPTSWRSSTARGLPSRFPRRRSTSLTVQAPPSTPKSPCETSHAGLAHGRRSSGQPVQHVVQHGPSRAHRHAVLSQNPVAEQLVHRIVLPLQLDPRVDHRRHARRRGRQSRTPAAP